jgi:hypothetical protein
MSKWSLWQSPGNRLSSDTFPNKNGLKQGGASSPLIFNFSFKYAIRRIEVNQDGLKVNDKLQVLFCADDINFRFWFVLTMLIQWTKAHILLNNTESLLVLVASKEILLEENADTTRYMMSRD